MSPEQYRRDGACANQSNRRTWLAGSQLFQHGSNGEELSERGKALLRAALTQRGESLAERAIVIEGYANGSVPPMSCGSPAAAPWRSANMFNSNSSWIRRISESSR